MTIVLMATPRRLFLPRRVNYKLEVYSIFFVTWNGGRSILMQFKPSASPVLSVIYSVE